MTEALQARARELAEALAKRGPDILRGIYRDELIAMLSTALEAKSAGVDRHSEEIANLAIEENLNPDGTAKYGTAQGYACALSALRIAALTSPIASLGEGRG